MSRQRQRQKKQQSLDADFCRRILITVGKADGPSAGTLGAVMYKLKMFDTKQAPVCTSRKLVEYLARPEYRHHLRPVILTSLEKIKTGAVASVMASAQISPKIAPQMNLLRDLGLVTWKKHPAPNTSSECLTALGVELFKDWPSLRAPVSRHVEHALSRASFAEKELALQAKRVIDLEKEIREKQHEIWKLRPHT
jgi:hypothetical protein